jgi:hypothetical protein
LTKRSKIYKLYSLIKVRIMKSSRSGIFVLCRSKISGNFCFKSMDLGMFDRFCPSLKTRALTDEKGLIYVDMIRIVKYMLYLCIEIMFGLTSGCRILKRNFCRLATMTLARSIERAGNHLKERED